MASIIDNEWRPSKHQGVLEKHQRYLEPYRPNDLYWALGLEEEFYLEASKPLCLTGKYILENQRPERYSVNYRSSFKEDILDNALRLWVGPDDRQIPIPLLVNGHAFSKTDLAGNAATTYSRQPRPNPKFNGKSVHQELCEKSLWLRENYEKAFCYDGNTVEIMTQNFYKATAESVCLELSAQRAKWASETLPAMNEMPAFREYGPLRLQTKNHGLAAYTTNAAATPQINLCNNGTLHVNLTMPTALNEEGWPSDPSAFREKHLNAIRLIQWVEPLLLAIYGEPDFLSEVSPSFSKASQRCAISRYISISNYDTKEGQVGKLLTTKETPDWYMRYSEESAYKRLEEVGFDIQFSKFPRHGIELRIFDRLPDSRILPLVRFLVLLLDRSLELAGRQHPLLVGSAGVDIKRPQTFETWTNWVIDILRHGKDAVAEAEMVALYEELFGCKLPNTPVGIYNAATTHLEARYAVTGYCSSRMLKPVAPIATLPVKKGIFCCN